MRVVFMGSPEFAVPCLRAVHDAHEVVLVMSQPDKPAGRGKKLTAPAVKQFAIEHGLETYQPPSARKPEVAQRLRDTGAEIAIVVAYGKILPVSVLEAFPRGCINVHASVLPSYRGAAPIQWSIIRGDDETGVSIMQLDEGMDTGPVYRIARTPIEAHDTAGSLSERLARLGADTLLETLADIERGDAVAEAQDDDRASHARMLEKADGRIDWAADAGTVSCLIRGVDPWPGATASLGDQTIKLFGASTCEGQGDPGTILSVGDQGAVIACGQGAVTVAELQLPGKRRMAAGDAARGRAVGPGVVLG